MIVYYRWISFVSSGPIVEKMMRLYWLQKLKFVVTAGRLKMVRINLLQPIQPFQPNLKHK